MYFNGDLAELVPVSAGVVAAEQKLSAGKDEAHVSLGAATVTAVRGSKD